MLISYFAGVILAKNVAKSGKFREKIKREVGHIGFENYDSFQTMYI